jgi:hypothetical protein
VRLPQYIAWPKPLHQDTHTYRLSKFLKIIRHIPAAEKRDYEAGQKKRQPVQLTSALPNSCKQKRLA